MFYLVDSLTNEQLTTLMDSFYVQGEESVFYNLGLVLSTGSVELTGTPAVDHVLPAVPLGVSIGDTLVYLTEEMLVTAIGRDSITVVRGTNGGAETLAEGDTLAVKASSGEGTVTLYAGTTEASISGGQHLVDYGVYGRHPNGAWTLLKNGLVIPGVTANTVVPIEIKIHLPSLVNGVQLVTEEGWQFCQLSAASGTTPVTLGVYDGGMAYDTQPYDLSQLDGSGDTTFEGLNTVLLSVFVQSGELGELINEYLEFL